MNTIKKHIKVAFKASAAVFAFGAASIAFSSCSDFLHILPLNEVVLENYWTEEADVTSVLNSCYESLESTESLRRMGIWGELRSDNVIPGRNASYDVNEMLKENILPTNSLVKWDVMYETINRCNTVCYYAPGVQERDPNYTLSEMEANVAEATFIRDLCYFYLLRTFRDVPMTFDPSLDDQKNYQIAPTKFYDGLDLLIDDLKKVEMKAVRRYVDDSRMQNDVASKNAAKNSSRVTRSAIQTLIAELSLWRGNYDDVVSYCDKVLDYKKEQYEDKKLQLGEILDMDLINGIPLILDTRRGSNTGGNSYTEIFGDKNSFESIFELYFETNQSVSNSYVNDYYMSSSQNGYFECPSTYRKDVADGKNILFDKRDSRAYSSVAVQNSSYRIMKYVASRCSFKNTNTTEGDVNLTRRGNAYANWIIYRLTDVILMKAEALIMKGEDNLEEAFNLINTVNMRARNIASANDGDALTFANYNTTSTIYELLFNERNREFMYEGKRWYDLVRISLREGNTHTLVNNVTKVDDKFTGSNASAVKIKLSDPNIIFLPYYREELKLNPYLKQNSAYNDTEEFQQ